VADLCPPQALPDGFTQFDVIDGGLWRFAVKQFGNFNREPRQWPDAT
jgi:hypothetical protein